MKKLIFYGINCAFILKVMCSGTFKEGLTVEINLDEMESAIVEVRNIPFFYYSGSLIKNIIIHINNAKGGIQKKDDREI